MLALYNILLHLALLVTLPLWPLLFFSKRRLYRGVSERLGFYPRSTAVRAHSRPIWIHAASVGEVKSTAPLIEAIRTRFPDRGILLSTMTATGRTVARAVSLQKDAVVYFPLDLSWVVARMLQRFEPAILVLLETEIWPNTVHTVCRRGVPVVLVSGRISARSARWYRRFPWVFVRVLCEISGFGMQDGESARRLLELGVNPDKVRVTGSLKHAAFPAPEPPVELTRVTGLTGRGVVVAGSTHRGEEEIFIEALERLKTEVPRLLLVLAPRHPERFAEVEALLRRAHVRFRKRSAPGAIELEDSDVLLIDSLGELPWIYAWAHVVFVGGTLARVGGHNLLEPARWGKPILIGPHTSNITQVAQAMIDGGGAIEVGTEEELIHQLTRLLKNGVLAENMGQSARSVATGDHQVVTDTMKVIGKVLETSDPSQVHTD